MEPLAGAARDAELAVRRDSDCVDAAAAAVPLGEIFPLLNVPEAGAAVVVEDQRELAVGTQRELAGPTVRGEGAHGTVLVQVPYFEGLPVSPHPQCEPVRRVCLAARAAVLRT